MKVYNIAQKDNRMKTDLMIVSLLVVFGLNLNIAQAEDVKPLQALLITGGGYHDYQNQKRILSEGISARANVEWTVVLENPKAGQLPLVYQNEDWIKGYDVIVHNECFAQYSDVEGIEKIVKTHLESGVGVVMIHCAMHTFRDGKTKEWDKLVGVESRRHGAKFPIVVRNIGRDHPITMNSPAMWTTPRGELYHTSIIPSATQLAVGFKEGEEAKTKQVCIWVNEYGKCRTFGTTLGHHNETMQEKVYLDTITRGLLWSCRKLDDQGNATKGYGKTAAIKRPTKYHVLLAHGRSLRFNNTEQLRAAGLKFDSPPGCCGQ
jgi:type 1 glutamine amidotransferase